MDDWNKETTDSAKMSMSVSWQRGGGMFLTELVSYEFLDLSRSRGLPWK